MIPFVCTANGLLRVINLALVTYAEIDHSRSGDAYLQLWGIDDAAWEIRDTDDIERFFNLLKISVVDRRRMGWQ